MTKIAENIYCFWQTSKTNFVFFNEVVIGESSQGQLFKQTHETLQTTQYNFQVDLLSFKSGDALRDEKVIEFLKNKNSTIITLETEKLTSEQIETLKVKLSQHELCEIKIKLSVHDNLIPLKVNLKMNSPQNLKIEIKTTFQEIKVSIPKFLFGLGGYVHEPLNLTAELAWPFEIK